MIKEYEKKEVFGATSIVAASSILNSQELLSADNESSNEYYELRRYELTFAGNQKALLSYLREVLVPALRSIGIRNAALFSEEGDAEPSKIWLMVAYPDLSTYEKSVLLMTDESFIAQASSYAKAGEAFNRYTSYLLRAFDGLPQMIEPQFANPLFELRIYEGTNEDSVRRKVMMFDDEEFELFYKVGLNPVFFGKMLIGDYMPALVYMLAFDNMDERQEAWTEFLQHPEWSEMKNKPIYQDTVSNIRKIFLRLL